MRYVHALKVGQKFRWMRRTVHVVLFFKEDETNMVLLKFWSKGRQRWGYQVEYLGIVQDMRRDSTNIKDLLAPSLALALTVHEMLQMTPTTSVLNSSGRQCTHRLQNRTRPWALIGNLSIHRHLEFPSRRRVEALAALAEVFSCSMTTELNQALQDKET